MVRRESAVLQHFVRLLLLLLAVAPVLVLPRAARADQPGAHTVPVAVLAFDSEDAEEHADAITGALRSRVRAAQGWSLIETTQSLGMLTAAYKCPTRPTPECQQKIAEQLKTERYIWGLVSKGPGAGQVTAETHLFQRGKPDTVIRETYADNLKDSNDDTLRKIAARIVERIGGSAVGVIVVRSSEQTGEVIVDGEKHVPLEKGTARLELAAGGHSVEVATSKGPPVKRNVLVTAGRETVVELTPVAAVEPPQPEARSNTRTVVGGVVMGAGAVLGAVAVLQLVRYFDLQDQGDARAAELDRNVNGDKQCKEYDAKCSEIDKDSRLASGLAWGLGAGGLAAIGVGAYLFFSDPGSNEKGSASAASKPRMRVVPSVSAGSGGLTVLGSF